MTTLKGLLYVKHGLIGREDEGPDYYLQTMHGDFLLQYEDRPHWIPDYHLEYFCRRIVEVEGEVLPERKVQVKSIKQLFVPLIPLYTYYKARIVNNSSAKITAIHLGMTGAGNMTIASLRAGASTEELTFMLLDKDPSAPLPTGYGDYIGEYTQRGVQKQIRVTGPKLMTMIKINNESYQVD